MVSTDNSSNDVGANLVVEMVDGGGGSEAF